MGERPPTCSGEQLPLVELSLAKKKCIRVQPGAQLSNPAALAAFVNRLYGCQPQEVVLAVHLDSRLQPLNVQVVSLGGFSASPVDPRVVFGGALTSGARGFVLVHTHPSGEAIPSIDDDRLTERLAQGARALGLSLFDHVVVARGGKFFSYQANGRLPS